MLNAHAKSPLSLNAKETGEEHLGLFGAVHLLPWGEAIITGPAAEKSLPFRTGVGLPEVSENGEATAFGAFAEIYQAIEMASGQFPFALGRHLIDEKPDFRGIC